MRTAQNTVSDVAPLVLEGLPYVKHRKEVPLQILDQMLKDDEECTLMTIPDEETQTIYTTLQEKPKETSDFKLIT